MSLTKTALKIASLLQHRILPLVAAAYVLASAFPLPGQCIKHLSIDVGMKISVPMVLLGVLLFNASIGAAAGEMASVFREPLALLLGIALNVLMPTAFLFALKSILQTWHDQAEAEGLLLGLSVVAAMPIAGSSTAWSHATGGNVALSLGLVVASTFLSPFTTPMVLASLTPGDAGFSAFLGTGTFLLAVVVFPSALGFAARRIISEATLAKMKPFLKASSIFILIVLCYCNACDTMPQVWADPDWDYLLLVFAASTGLCVSAFGGGWLLSRWMRTDAANERSLMYALGMSNNGTGLVVAGSILAATPHAIVPVLAYNLIQHVVAAKVSRMLQTQDAAD